MIMVLIVIMIMAMIMQPSLNALNPIIYGLLHVFWREVKLEIYGNAACQCRCLLNHR